MKYDGPKRNVISICGYSASFSFAMLSMISSIFLATVSGCWTPSDGATKTTLSRSDLFRLHCSGCHGDGSGNGHVAAGQACGILESLRLDRRIVQATWLVKELARSANRKTRLSERLVAFLIAASNYSENLIFACQQVES